MHTILFTPYMLYVYSLHNPCHQYTVSCTSSSNNLLLYISDFIQSIKHTNTIQLSVPQRHDLINDFVWITKLVSLIES